MVIKLILVALVTFFLNLPCGYWRQGSVRFSLSWILAVHLPIPFVVGLRYITGLGFHWSSYPAILVAYMAGQYLGARWRRNRQDFSA